ncbi:hypothetical protein [Desulfonema magnum]|uniref:Uncharacterized protein n=1 Tax=Desulfonema magnum TaxID=45655 RepID=A0A975GLZ8_9BACT|nr:hypothetical protein [Desulfonema magnum]QTA86292.1 Uncharacterized protein dnm_023130 [Desulfonema magnum]
MSQKKQNNLIRRLCGGINKRFAGCSCNNYERSTTQCRLLRKHRMNEFWEKCRGEPFTMMYDTVTKITNTFRLKYPSLHISEVIDIDIKDIVTRLKTYHLKEEFTIIAWRNYMHKTVYREIKGYLIKKGWLPRVNQCGTCKYFPESEPYICPKNGKQRKKTDGTCEKYSQKLGIFISINGYGHDDQKNNAHLSDKFQYNDETPETILEKKNDPLLMIKHALCMRIDTASPETKQRAKYQRQYEVFISLLHLLSEGVPMKKAQKTLAKQNSVAAKTIQRDISEIRKFQKKMSSEARI